MKREKTMTMFSFRSVLLGIFFLVAISVIVGLGVNSVRKDSIPLMENWQQKVKEKSAQRSIGNGIRTITLEQLKERLASGDAVIVDARDPEYYDMGHIPGAINLPIHTFSESFPAVRDRLGFEKPVIIYCEGYNCEMSDQLAEQLTGMGYFNILIYRGGIEEWTDSGQEVEKNE
jgi:rhodanese-related sulfurtransferase